MGRNVSDVMRGGVIEGKYIPSQSMEQGLQTIMASCKRQQNPVAEPGEWLPLPGEPYKFIALVR